MRNYRIDMNRLVNQLLPHYLGGRKLVLFIQALLNPLDKVNKEWVEWANEQRMKAAMTSQVILLEHFLNHKFRKYFMDQTQRIFITEKAAPGTVMYWEKNKEAKHLVTYEQSETDKENPSLRWDNERTDVDDYSFTISCPEINTQLISEREMTAMIDYQIKQYCLAGKNYEVTYNEEIK